MQRSSESFAALAAALAKAQAQLVNPEKSLTATIRTGHAGETQRSFRYAPLSSGLEIVRKTLSEQQIAVIQTTTVDQASRMVQLTTLLAHASGEWISSQWPVCAVADVAHPHRMGAALTYARRYALFTLVGIAGEDDLDAPDVCAPMPTAEPATGRVPSYRGGNGKVRGNPNPAGPAILPVNESAALRDTLMSGVSSLGSHEDAAKWALQALSDKNRLTAGDAKNLETAFERKLSQFPLAQIEAVVAADSDPAAKPTLEPAPSSDAVGPKRAGGIDKSALVLSTPRRYRNKDHLRFVARQPCLLCARKPSDPHHLRFMRPVALGRKASDEFAVPLCRIHHRAAHLAGDERSWWKTAGIDPVEIARKLWKKSHGVKADNRPKVRAVGAETNPADVVEVIDGKVP